MGQIVAICNGRKHRRLGGMASPHNPSLIYEKGVGEIMAIDLITLGGGCFWCLEAVYEQVQGVVAVESGYCNGQVRT